MPILTQRPVPTPSHVGTIQKTQQAVIADPEYRGATVDTRYLNHRALLTHIAGSSWITKYYSQLLGRDNELTPQQLDKNAVYQQYHEISELELRVTGPLTSSQTVETREFQVTGTATVYPPLIPNVGDMFLADIGDGREGLFALTSTNRLSILTDTCYEIEYILVSEADETHRRDLEKKTVKQTHFVRNVLEQGGDPFLITEDYHTYRSLEAVEKRLLGNYLPTFFFKQISSLAVPGQSYVTYDPWVVRFLQKLLDTDRHPILRVLKSYAIALPGKTELPTLWDAILATDLDLLPLCHEKLALVDAKRFGVIPQFEGIYWSQVEDVVYPVDRHQTDLLFDPLVTGQYLPRDIRHQFATTTLGSLAQLLHARQVGLGSLPSIHPVVKDSYYVLTEAFYFTSESDQSQLEVLTHHALTGQPVDREALLKLCEDQPRWGQLEQFYYTPILLALLKLSRQVY